MEAPTITVTVGAAPVSTGVETASDEPLEDIHRQNTTTPELPETTSGAAVSVVLSSSITGLSGSGTSADPYRIYTADELRWLADQVVL
ncbi:MAG: hypothetical protein ACOX4M_03805 [Acetivibrionales bacterium]